jgi:hypothetical protein
MIARPLYELSTRSTTTTHRHHSTHPTTAIASILRQLLFLHATWGFSWWKEHTHYFSPKNAFLSEDTPEPSPLRIRTHRSQQAFSVGRRRSCRDHDDDDGISITQTLVGQGPLPHGDALTEEDTDVILWRIDRNPAETAAASGVPLDTIAGPTSYSFPHHGNSVTSGFFHCQANQQEK